MTAHKPGESSKQWGSGHTFKRSLTPRDHRPHAACPTCYLDATSTDPGQLVEYRCPRGHTFTAYRSDGISHATFLARYHSGTQDNR